MDIDIKHYQTEELKQKINDALQFPSFAFIAFLIPTLIFSVLFAGVAISYFYFGFTQLGITFACFGLISAVLTGAIIGMFGVSKRMTFDLQALFKESLLLLKNICDDYQNKPTIKEKPSLSELLKTSNDRIFLPLVAQNLGKRIPFIGSTMDWMLERAFHIIEKQILVLLEEGSSQPPSNEDSSQDAHFQHIGIVALSLQSRIAGTVIFVKQRLIRPIAWGMWFAIFGNLWVLGSAIWAAI